VGHREGYWGTNKQRSHSSDGWGRRPITARSAVPARGGHREGYWGMGGGNNKQKLKTQTYFKARFASPSNLGPLKL
jgi:hypothetical protein